jgi:hypothetical protein
MSKIPHWLPIGLFGRDAHILTAAWQYAEDYASLAVKQERTRYLQAIAGAFQSDHKTIADGVYAVIESIASGKEFTK